jgi:predicted phosphoribosyltransferase
MTTFLRRSQSADGALSTSFASQIKNDGGYDGDIDDVDSEDSRERKELQRRRMAERAEACLMLLRFDRMCVVDDNNNRGDSVTATAVYV